MGRKRALGEAGKVGRFDHCTLGSEPRFQFPHAAASSDLRAKTYLHRRSLPLLCLTAAHSEKCGTLPSLGQGDERGPPPPRYRSHYSLTYLGRRGIHKLCRRF